MITLEEYLLDPCGKLSIPFWKWKGLTLPKGMCILHHREYTPVEGYADDSYFRLRHDLHGLAAVSRGITRTATREDIPTIASIINASYPHIRVSEAQVQSWMHTPVYDGGLWVLAEKNGEAVGCAIADLDREAGEGIVEWVQVLPTYRRQGIGRQLVMELLHRMAGKAMFATVSGQCRNENDPQSLYRACGFTGSDVWHILRKV